jgi:hypothetical protein
VDDICISPAALTVITTMVAALFWALIRSMQDSVREARAERDRMADGWEATIGLGEKAVRRERRRP